MRIEFNGFSFKLIFRQFAMHNIRMRMQWIKSNENRIFGTFFFIAVNLNRLNYSNRLKINELFKKRNPIFHCPFILLGCKEKCPDVVYGNKTCDHVTGEYVCQPGYIGLTCDQW